MAKQGVKVFVNPHEDGAELGKRTYLPFTVVANCPCRKGGTFTKDLTVDYLSYPIVGEISTVSFYCDACNEEFQVNLRLNITLTLEA